MLSKRLIYSVIFAHAPATYNCYDEDGEYVGCFHWSDNIDESTWNPAISESSKERFYNEFFGVEVSPECAMLRKGDVYGKIPHECKIEELLVDVWLKRKGQDCQVKDAIVEMLHLIPRIPPGGIRVESADIPDMIRLQISIRLNLYARER